MPGAKRLHPNLLRTANSTLTNVPTYPIKPRCPGRSIPPKHCVRTGRGDIGEQVESSFYQLLFYSTEMSIRGVHIPLIRSAFPLSKTAPIFYTVAIKYQ